METTGMQITTMSRRRALGLMAAGAGAALLAACGGGKAATETVKPAAAGATPAALGTRSAADGMQTLVIEAVDFGYKTMGSITAGPTRVQLKNLGAEPHHAQFMLLNPGVTLDQFGAAFKQGPGAAFPLVTFLGGPGAVAPTGQTEVLLDLPAGQYVLACFVEGQDHIAHAAKGMTLPLMVNPSTVAPAPLPTPAATIALVDFTFEIPPTLPAGRSLVRVMNKGPQPHEFNLVQLAPGKTLDDVKAFFDPMPGAAPAGPPPGLPIGGMNALAPGKEGTAVLDLRPGNYAAICNVPDQSAPNGPSHLHLGMIKGFTVL